MSRDKSRAKAKDVVFKKEDVIVGCNFGKADDNYGQLNLKKIDCLEDIKEEYVETHDPSEFSHTIRPNTFVQFLAYVSCGPTFLSFCDPT